MSMDEIYGTSIPYEAYEYIWPKLYHTESNCSIFSFGNDFSMQEHPLDPSYNFSNDMEINLAEDHSYYNNEDNRPCLIRWKSGKRVDPRLLTLLESFREVYEKRKGFFKRIFPGNYEEFVDVFDKFHTMRAKNDEIQSKTLERSLSFGSFREVRQNGEGFEFKDEAFKVKAPKVVVEGPDGVIRPTTFK